MCASLTVMTAGVTYAGCVLSFFFFKQKTAYEMRISDWSSDVCSSDLGVIDPRRQAGDEFPARIAGIGPVRARQRIGDIARRTVQLERMDERNVDRKSVG